jgi:uncharacterized membrane protein
MQVVARAGMDPGPFFGMLAFMSVMGVIVLRPLVRAYAERLRGRSQDATLDSRDIEALQGEVAQLRRELDEVQNRLDFTERLLAQARERGLLAPPKER